MTQIIEGVIIIFLGLLTLLPGIPIIWVGAFLWGGWLIVSGLVKIVSDLVKLVTGRKEESKPIYVMPSDTDRTNVVFTCGQCNRKAVFPKGKGAIKIKCLGCSREYKITT